MNEDNLYLKPVELDFTKPSFSDKVNVLELAIRVNPKIKFPQIKETYDFFMNLLSKD